MDKSLIAIADDHELFREGMKLVLENSSKFILAHEVGNGKELLSLLEQYTGTSLFPELVLLDINMPEMNGYETMEILGERYPDLPVLALTMYSADFTILNMMRLGARGFLPKNSRKELLFNALEQLIAGDFYIPQELSNLFVASKGKQVPGLTHREIEFLSLCHLDLSYKEIGDRMACSERTVHAYRDKLLLKTGRKSRNGLIAYAYDIGIITG